MNYTPLSPPRAVNGVPHVKGWCLGIPTMLTEDTCHAVGTCSCKGRLSGSGDTDRARCESSYSVGGNPCVFTPTGQWQREPAPLTFGVCSDPAFATAEECLSGGACSDPAPDLQSREACERAGECVSSPEYEDPVPNRPALPCGQFNDQAACENPAQRPPPAKEKGTCVAQDGGPLDYDFARFSSSGACENPESRPGGWACEGVTAAAGVPAARFKSQVTCEVPGARTGCTDAPPPPPAPGAPPSRPPPPWCAAGTEGRWVDQRGPPGTWTPDESAEDASVNGNDEDGG